MSKLLPQTTFVIATFLGILNFSEIIPKAAIASNLSSSTTDHLFSINQDWRGCPQIGKDYQEVEAFETENFYVNICRQGDRFFYLGEAKNSAINSIFLPAYLLDEQKYRADNGNLSYLVTLNNYGDTLAVQQNGHQIAFERSLTQYCSLLNYSLSLNFSFQLHYNSDEFVTFTHQEKFLLSQLHSQKNFNFQQQQKSEFIRTSRSHLDFRLYNLEKGSFSSIACS